MNLPSETMTPFQVPERMRGPVLSYCLLAGERTLRFRSLRSDWRSWTADRKWECTTSAARLRSAGDRRVRRCACRRCGPAGRFAAGERKGAARPGLRWKRRRGCGGGGAARLVAAVEQFRAARERYFADVEQEVVKLALAICGAGTASRGADRSSAVDAERCGWRWRRWQTGAAWCCVLRRPDVEAWEQSFRGDGGIGTARG